ncbi:MAG: precorrin-8X methylmutase [Devosiaceae bacterium]|nr:precorrin-8X methylmutase [Devosiaceae bacterium]
MSYLRDPAAIYEKSFKTIRDEADLSRFLPDERDLVIRLIHACGMVDIVDSIEISNNGIALGMDALANGAPIICDVNMVARGIITRKLVAQNQVLCGLDLKGAKKFATDNSHTRSAGGIDALADKIEGAIIAIGNAPTALFHLLEMIDSGAKKPAIILGFPVGFVGAAESKAELAANRFDIPYVTLLGRRGGSAFAAAAVNALASGLKT